MGGDAAVLLQAISFKNSAQLSALALSPVLCEPVEDDDGTGKAQSRDRDASAIPRSREQEVKEIHAKEGSRGKWQGHRHLLDATSGFLKDESTVPEGAQDTRLSSLLMAWLDAQVALSGGALSSGEPTQDVPISGEAIVHLIVGSGTDKRTEKEGQLGLQFAQGSSMPEVFVNTGHMNRAIARNFFFLLSAFSDVKGSAHHGRQPRVGHRQLSEENDMSLANILLRKEMLRLQSHATPQQDKAPTGLTLQQGLPCHLSCISGMNLEVVEGPGLKSLTWLEGPASKSLGSKSIGHDSKFLKWNVMMHFLSPTQRFFQVIRQYSAFCP